MTLRSQSLRIDNLGHYVLDPIGNKKWQETLDKGIQIVESIGFHYQLGGGTLLGMIREENGVIMHDSDLDLDIMVTEWHSNFTILIANLIAKMKEEGYNLVRTQYFGSKPMQIAFNHVENEIVFDLYFYYQRWGQDYLSVGEHGIYVRPDWSVRDLKLEKLGSNYNIPFTVGRYLEGRFGSDWKTPKKSKTDPTSTAGKYLLKL